MITVSDFPNDDDILLGVSNSANGDDEEEEGDDDQNCEVKNQEQKTTDNKIFQPFKTIRKT